MALDDFMSDLESNYISQIICLTCQLVLTIHTSENLRKNKEQFPVKQLSPLLSLSALFSFFLLNIISFISRIIQQSNDYYDPNLNNGSMCGQCRLYNHPEMIVLAFLYNGLRQLPLILFIIKTYRVCLCYEKSYDQQLSEKIVKIFSSQRKLLLLSFIITLIFMLVGFIIFGQGTSYNGAMVFQFFCPKQSSIYDWIVTALRFCFLTYVYAVSIYTYSELDFKKFLLLIFILTNTQVILRLFLALEGISQTTYHQFYYHSFFMNLFGTLIMFYYSSIKQQRNRPLGSPILQNFNGFLQTTLGFSVLMLFARHLDKQNKAKKNEKIFTAYIKIDEMNMLSEQQNFHIQDYINEIIDTLESIQILYDLKDRQQLIQKCNKKQITTWQLKNVETKLAQYCQTNIFNEWRQTQSSKYLEQQFKNNGVINLRMFTLGIQL